jgi:uncharacterized protein YceH (UPF0502 family)
MSDIPTAETSAPLQKPRWQPLSVIDRRVAGVLIEKAKTTPEAYPLSLNAVCTGCNQKSNRAPLMQLEPDQVQESLDRLRQLGAVGLIEGVGRVAKYRHYLYDWLGVDKVELAVMAELLLRGDQTEGELRTRASRMESIADLTALRTILNGLMAKGLLVSLTSEGRGHVVSHALYVPAELERLKARYAQQRPTDLAQPDTAEATSAVSTPLRLVAGAAHGSPQALDDLKEQMEQLRHEVSDLSAAVGRMSDELQRLKADLGVG